MLDHGPNCDQMLLICYLIATLIALVRSDKASKKSFHLQIDNLIVQWTVTWHAVSDEQYRYELLSIIILSVAVSHIPAEAHRPRACASPVQHVTMHAM